MMIKLIPFTREHFDDFISWIDNEALLVTIAGYVLKYPLTTAQLEGYLNDPKSLSFTVVDSATAMPIGHAEIIFNGDGSCKLDKVLLGEKSNRGKGLGQALMIALTTLAFELPDISVVELNVYDWNKSAIRVYEKIGFVINPAKVTTSEINGETWTALNMTMGREERQRR